MEEERVEERGREGEQERGGEGMLMPNYSYKEKGRRSKCKNVWERQWDNNCSKRERRRRGREGEGGVSQG